MRLAALRELGASLAGMAAAISAVMDWEVGRRSKETIAILDALLCMIELRMQIILLFSWNSSSSWFISRVMCLTVFLGLMACF